ncbi:MAG: glycosyltransferase family 2 protein [Nanoarchaeota archaeon]|nr:glycosyltransferase family 2 protein [Nanoarchaeota archaeon]
MAVAIDEQVAKVIIWILYFVGLYFSFFWLSVLIFDPKDNSKKKRKVWPEVTVILPMYNEQKHVEWTLDSVYNLDYPKNKLKVICVNDGSTDNTLKILKKLNQKYDFKLINKKNGGKHTALNEALKVTKTPYFACLDVDCYVESNALKNIIEEFDTKDVASVMPIMKVNNPENILQRVQWLEYIMNIFYKYIMGKLDCIHVTPGPFATYRTKIVQDLGGFRKGHMTEDLEMALRLQNNHYILKQTLNSVVYTASPKTTKAFISQRTRWYQGTLLNVMDYKHFLFNRKYGEFGMYHMPLVAITGILALVGVLTMIYLFLKEMYFTIKRMYLTHFDFWTYITNYKWNTGWLDFDYQVMFSSLVLFMLIFIIIYLSFAGTREKTSLLRNFKYFFMFLYYFFVYKFVMGYIWFKVVWKVMLKKGNKWEKVN